MRCFSSGHARKLVLGTELFSGGPLSLPPPYPILYPFLCFCHPETATCKTELLRFPSSSAIAFHIPSCNNKSYISLQQPRTDFYTGIRYSAPPPTNKNRREQNKTIAFLHLTCQEGARHYSWRVKNLFCFCVKGRSVQVVSVSELSFLWK